MDRRTVFSLFLIATSTTGDYRIRFVARNNSDNIIASMRNDGTSGSTDYKMALHKWHHIAITRDGTTARLFVDGNLLDSSTDPDFVLSTPSGNTVNYAARYWGSYSRFFDGALDEMRYSDIARYTSAFTITTNTNPHPTSGDSHTILLFNFDKSNVDNSTSANTYSALIHHSPLTYTNWDGFPGDELPLPVTYIEALKARLNQNNTIDLSWATASEEINYGYIIQRSPDAEHWDSLGFVQGAGNSNTILKYHFTDVKPLKSNYYQLKQLDYNGKEHLSSMAFISYQTPEKLKIYPNPALNQLNLSNASDANTSKIEIYNFIGKRLRLIQSDFQQINISNLAQGVYFIVVYDFQNNSQRLSFIKR